jgi:hypothetical protein
VFKVEVIFFSPSEFPPATLLWYLAVGTSLGGGREVAWEVTVNKSKHRTTCDTPGSLQVVTSLASELTAVFF